MTRALLLCTPVAMCEILVCIMAGISKFNVTIPDLSGLLVLLMLTMDVLLFAGIVTVIVSLVLYLRRPLRRKPWFVYLNLAINIGGILFFVYAVASGLADQFTPGS